MREVAGAVLGLVYCLTISSGLWRSVENLPGAQQTTGFGEHYILVAITWLIGVFSGALVAAGAAKRRSVFASTAVALPLPALLTYLFVTRGGAGFDYPLSPLVFGWRPNSLGFMFVVGILTLFVGYGAGRFAIAEIVQQRETRIANARGVIWGIRWGHWLWLWVPMYLWALLVAPAFYLLWLSIATGWHWLVHPSLWFNWRWLLYGFFGVAFTVMPYALLLQGIGGALEALADDSGRSQTSGGTVARFLGYGFLLAVVATGVSIEIAFWALSKLPIAARVKPWWVVF